MYSIFPYSGFQSMLIDGKRFDPTPTIDSNRFFFLFFLVHFNKSVCLRYWHNTVAAEHQVTFGSVTGLEFDMGLMPNDLFGPKIESNGTDAARGQSPIHPKCDGVKQYAIVIEIHSKCGTQLTFNVFCRFFALFGRLKILRNNFALHVD